jgi:type I restriction enzyme R subunit
MNGIGKPERETQNRVAAFFVKRLGYRYLGDWTDRIGNSNIEEGILGEWLKKRGESAARIAKAINVLKREADHAGRGLYANNQAVYSLLRYGIPVQTEAGQNHETVHLIDWQNPEENDFAIAEEVTLRGPMERRPDIVVYVNGIAVAVLELKNSRVSIGDGIRQNLSNQQPEFNAWFFSTVQLILAGNDSEGLQYGTILTPEKFFLKWKEDEQDNSGYKLDKYLEKICRKDRLIELIHDFILFDNGVKKVPRVHQYFGIKAAQEKIRQREGGIIWHTQGSGKSIVMVLLAKWILENNPNARVAIITDRDELDKQIDQVFTATNQTIHRTSSGKDLMSRLAQPLPRLLCSLIHKRSQGCGGLQRIHQGTGVATLQNGGRDFCVCGRVSPDAERQAAPGHESHDAECDFYRFLRHTPTQERQPDEHGSLRRLHSHLQIQRGRGGRCRVGFDLRGP